MKGAKTKSKKGGKRRGNYRRRAGARRYKNKRNVWNFKMRGSDTYITSTATANQLVINNSNTYLTTNGGTAPTPYAGNLIALQPCVNNARCSAFGMSAAFSANQCVAYPALANNFDRYRVNLIKVKIYPSTNIAMSAGTSTLGRLSWRFDPDDSRISTNGNSILGTSHKTVSLTKPITIYIKPKVVVSLNNTANTTVNGNFNGVYKSPWVNVGQPNVQLYGLKMWFDDLSLPASANFDIKIETTYYVSFKDMLNGSSPLGDEEEYDPNPVSQV